MANYNSVQFSAALPEMVESLVLIEGFGYLTAPRVGSYICFMFTQLQNIYTHIVFANLVHAVCECF